MPSLGKMKLRSTSKQSKEKPVESQTGESKNDKKKAMVAGTSVGNGSTNAPLVTQSSNSSSSKTKMVTRAKPQNLAIGVCVSAPLPSNKGPAKISKTSSGLNVNPPPSSAGGPNVNSGPAASTRGKRKADVAASAAIPTPSTLAICNATTVKATGTHVGNGMTNTSRVTQQASSSASMRTKKTRAKSPDTSILGSKKVSALLPSSKMPAPSKPPIVLKTLGVALTVKPLQSGSGSGGVIPNTGSTALTGVKKKADVATGATISMGSIIASSNPTGHLISGIANVTPSVPAPTIIYSVGGIVGSISNIICTFANMYGARQTLPPLQSTEASGSSTPKTATAPAPANIPGSSGAVLPAFPPNWETRYIETYNSSSVYQTFSVDKSSSEFKAIADLLSPFRVTSAEQIINPELWQSFDEKRKAMLRSKTDDPELLKALGFDSSAVARNIKFSENFTKHPQLIKKYSANLALLLHCTRVTTNLEKIMSQGLDERLGGGGGILGRGVYFSDDPEKCVQYDGTWGTILVFGVLLGDCLSVDKIPNVRSFVREPEKMAEQKRHNNDHFFDSITGRPHRVHNEYVIFNRNQCYPFYIVKYQRGFKEHLDGSSQVDIRPERFGHSYTSARKSIPMIAWDSVVGVPMPRYLLWTLPWPFSGANIFKLMGNGESSTLRDNVAPATASSDKIKPTGTTTDLVNTDGKPVKRRRTNDEECSICTKRFAAFLTSSSLWKELKCGHRVCSGCFINIEVSRITMSGMPCTSVRCPFCQGITGITVGDCPDGLMTVSYINSFCKGKEKHNTIQINYTINSGTHQLNRTAYLPNSPEGKEILELLITAWDRKLTFMIGTSMTSGKQNVLVWNIHHKTCQTGGVQKYGYPDEGYFTRVRAELKAYGIE